MAQFLRVVAESADHELTIDFRFRNDYNCTAYLPVVICNMLARKEVQPTGLHTAVDIVTPERLFTELEHYRQAGFLDWSISASRKQNAHADER